MKSSVILLLVFILPLFAHAQSMDDTAASGQMVLRAGDYETARTLFREGLERARESNNDEWIAKFSFYNGNVDLVEASSKDAANPNLASQAANNYRNVLALRPKSGSAMVNLARALTLLGEDEEADAWYRSAIKSGGNKEVLYRKQYAEYLEQRNPEEAASQLRAVIAAEPKSANTHRQLVQTYMDPKFASRLPEYLQQQVQNGDVLRAQGAALEALRNPDWAIEYKDDLMTVLGASLAGQHITPTEFAGSDTAVMLRTIAVMNPTLRRCIGELIETMSNGERPNRYTWWTADATRTSTISQLLRSQAQSSAQSGDDERAETLYNDAVKLKGANGPKALLDLVEFYSERGDTGKIHAISKKYENQLFSGKAAAYQRGDDREIYSFHRTLASIYANQAMQTGDWGSRGNVTSAAFQLEHAYRTAKRSGSITPDTLLVDQLARSYEATRGENAGNIIRLDAASIYANAGDAAAATKVLRPINADSLSDDQRLNYQRLYNIENANLQNPVRPESLQKHDVEHNNMNRNETP